MLVFRLIGVWGYSCLQEAHGWWCPGMLGGQGRTALSSTSARRCGHILSSRTSASNLTQRALPSKAKSFKGFQSSAFGIAALLQSLETAAPTSIPWRPQMQGWVLLHCTHDCLHSQSKPNTKFYWLSFFFAVVRKRFIIKEDEGH